MTGDDNSTGNGAGIENEYSELIEFKEVWSDTLTHLYKAHMNALNNHNSNLADEINKSVRMIIDEEKSLSKKIDWIQLVCDTFEMDRSNSYGKDTISKYPSYVGKFDDHEGQTEAYLIMALYDPRLEPLREYRSKEMREGMIALNFRQIGMTVIGDIKIKLSEEGSA